MTGHVASLCTEDLCKLYNKVSRLKIKKYISVFSGLCRVCLHVHEKATTCDDAFQFCSLVLFGFFFEQNNPNQFLTVHFVK